MSLVHLIVLSLALGAAAWLFFVWTVRSGQYDDPEGPKYRMLDDDDQPGAAPPPGERSSARSEAERSDGRPTPR
jgi:cbb3-type cytochrome oxidase maturation protein